jgi:23S rRNA (cytidine1920-2'-O)/16S rRNA (cytidine1409-2'-O)-methyltransferase
LDQLLVQRGLAESGEQARQLIRAGRVLVQGQPAPKPGHAVDPDISVTVEAPPRFVSRGGDKLEEAFVRYPIDVTDRVCLDVGASTGGFTDCLLQHGARRVFAVDVGKGQLHWKLRQDPRVTVYEGVNARVLDPALFDEPLTFAVADVSFISLTKVLPAVTNVLVSGSGVVTLIKPQFEAGREQVGKGGVVRSDEVREAVVARIREFVTGTLGWVCEGVCLSPLKGPAGNVEFVAYWRKP